MIACKRINLKTENDFVPPPPQQGCALPNTLMSCIRTISGGDFKLAAFLVMIYSKPAQEYHIRTFEAEVMSVNVLTSQVITDQFTVYVQTSTNNRFFFFLFKYSICPRQASKCLGIRFNRFTPISIHVSKRIS